MRFSDGYEPHGDTPFQLTPELSLGSYFEKLSSHSQRIEGDTALYLPPLHWVGLHNLKAGIDVDHIGFDEAVTRAPVNYLREDGTLLRRSEFPPIAPSYPPQCRSRRICRRPVDTARRPAHRTGPAFRLGRDSSQATGVAAFGSCLLARL